MLISKNELYVLVLNNPTSISSLEIGKIVAVKQIIAKEENMLSYFFISDAN
jgi:hypothetical protein